MLISDKRLWENHVKKARESGEVLPDVPFDDVKSFVERGEFDIEFHPEGNLRVEFDAMDEVLPLLGQREWSILLAPPDGPEFVCSDHPVAIVWKGARDGPIGYGLRNTEVFFPLGRRVGFYGVFERALKSVVSCRPMNVAIMNSHVVNGAERHVYSAREHFSVWDGEKVKEMRCEV